ncbi:uncharacterized protein LOC121734992 [Aricia agestis]|uniref:uncharacterized protein LOC121734992 n=1 Tax=Aricia agestis TaxID=91739 RepID=UPI001C20466B|nr:uncharacterized protein LOC121734992 [Aricia agestis]
MADGEGEGEGSQPRSETCKVSVKLPPFWPNKPAVWFAQVEAQFDIAGIVADSTKYSYIVGQIDHKYAGEIEDILVRPPEKGKQYETLKAELIKRLSLSEEQKVRQLLSGEETGDRKPSQFLRHLRSLAGVSLSDQNILKQLWLRRLPQNVQVILASQPDLSLEQLANLADKITELTGPPAVFSTAVPSASVSPSLPPSQDLLVTLMGKVEELSKQVNALSLRDRPQSRVRNRNRSRSRNSRANSPAPSTLCWYHRHFGVKGAKCIKPCTWTEPPENSRGNQ